MKHTTYTVCRRFYGPLPGQFSSRRSAILAARQRAQISGEWYVLRHHQHRPSRQVWCSWVTL